MTTLRLALAVVALSSLPALAQRCDAAALSDTLCDCGCLAVDSACPTGTFTVCDVSHCPAGQVPWEHSKDQCMSSACGDGWKDPAAGEACDDGNALASGGCSADCRSVNPGYACGDGAKGCRLAPMDAGTTMDAGLAADAGTTTVDAGVREQVDAGADASKTPTGGCSTGPAALLLGLAALLLRRRVTR
jgi:cysteine-rich repeat protein